MKIKLTNAKIMCSADKIIDGELHIKGNKIEYIGKSKEFEAERVIDCKNNLLMSGFCNAHTHTSMSLFRGYADDLPLKTWLFDKIFPIEANLTEEDIYWGTMLTCAEFVRGGTTAFADMYMFDDVRAEAVSKTNLAMAMCSGKNDLDGKTDKILDKNAVKSSL